MSYDTVTKRMKDIMMRVDDVHNVHTYLRDVPKEADFEAAFKVILPDKVLLTAWMMTRTGVVVERPTVDFQNMYDVDHRIEIQGFYGLDDANESEKSFQAVIDNLLNKFRKKYLLEDEAGIALTGIILTEPLQILEIGHGQFSNYFVHFARMVLSVKERLQ